MLWANLGNAGIWSLAMCASLCLIGCGNEPAPTQAPTANDHGDANDEVPAVMPGDQTKAKTANVRLMSQRITDGWIELYDRESLFGWVPNDADKTDEERVNWQIEDGAIVADSGSPALLQTFVPFADFELELDYKLEPGGNSGVFLRSDFDPKNPAENCYELNFCDSHKEFKTASLVDRAQPKVEVKGDGSWQRVRAKCVGNHITVHFNGKLVLDFHDETDKAKKSGYIGLQKNAGRIEFRKVVIKPLGMQPLFNGKNLDGWREVAGSQSEFTVKDGNIHVTNGRGYLETTDTFGDFVLQADAITHGEFLNSGIFFRAMPGTEKDSANGYEFQIQNEGVDGDLSNPKDFGTGGIYRRVKARRITAKDNQWTHLTLIAHGPRMQTWVNGFPVVAWEDERQPDENPRKGLRTAAGHFSLQGHDPTTHLDFKNLQLAPLP